MNLISTQLAFLNIGVGTMELMLLFIILGPVLIAGIFYLLTLQSTFRAIAIKNRKMDPNMVWLLLIPLFGFFWHFILIRDLASSIHDEALDKNIQLHTLRPGYNIGLAMCILSCLFFIPGLNIAAIVLWIIYWSKISEYKTQLINNP